MMNPYVTYNGQVGVRLSYLVADEDKRHEDSLQLISYAAYKMRAQRNPEFRLRTAGGAGNDVLINWVNLPSDWRDEFRKKLGDPEGAAKPNFLEKYYKRDPKAADFYANWKRPNGSNLDYKHIVEYTTNASMLNAVLEVVSNRKSFRKALGGTAQGIWDAVFKEVEALRAKTGHTLKIPSLKRTIAKYKKEGYEGLINGRFGNQNTAKIKESAQVAMIEELLKKHNNLDNEQVCSLYNIAAKQIGWETISAGTIANYRKELGLYIEAGRRGVSNFRNTRSMQVKRSAPSFPLYFWSIDGWEAELLYQKTEVNNKGYNVTTYHNRLTVVVILDPCCKYPIGYAIGTHETPGLIREALRNAANHTAELFGQRYKTLQLQSDNYSKGALTPIYEAMSKHYTPARVKNAKAKPIEPYFKALNKSIQMLPNWSGFGVTSKKHSQPNDEYLNKIRHSFPDQAGCEMQIMHALEMKRAAAKEKYLEKWEAMPASDKHLLSDEEYLNLFGSTTGFTNRLSHDGLNVTLDGQKYTYDSFDVRFRELSHIDWCVKYDPDNLDKVLVVDAEGRDGRLEKEINTIQFLLEVKYIQPLALHERMPGDATALARINQYNTQLENTIIDRGGQNMRVLDELFINTPQLEGTLTKLLLVDSMGQHKDNKSKARLMAKAKQLETKQQNKDTKTAIRMELEARESYLNSKINIDDFLNL